MTAKAIAAMPSAASKKIRERFIAIVFDGRRVTRRMRSIPALSSRTLRSRMASRRSGNRPSCELSYEILLWRRSELIGQSLRGNSSSQRDESAHQKKNSECIQSKRKVKLRRDRRGTRLHLMDRIPPPHGEVHDGKINGSDDRRHGR